MTKKLLLVDASNRAHAAFHAYKKLSYKGKSISMIFGFPAMLKYLIQKFEPSKVFIVWDEPTSSSIRKIIYSEYKGKRNKNLFDREDFERQRKVLMKMLFTMGLTQVSSKKGEADDVIYLLSQRGKMLHYKTTIVSSDKDFNQLITKNTKIWSEPKKELITLKNCFKVFGYHPHQCVDYLSLVGDTSDNIPGYPGIGPVKATKLLDKYDTLVGFIKSNDIFTGIDRDKLLEMIKTTSILIDLSIYHKRYMKRSPNKYYGDKLHPPQDEEKWLKLCKKHGLIKFRSKNYLQTFKNL